MPQSLSRVGPDSVLLRTLSVGPWNLAHRVVIAPPGRRWAHRTDGSATPEMTAFYGERASPGGLIVAEAAAVALHGQSLPGTACMFAASHANSWRPLVERVHSRGGIILAQLWHAGRSSRAAGGPSDEDQSGPGIPEAMVDEFTETALDQYRQAAEHAADAGFDGVELNAARGHLAGQHLYDGGVSLCDAHHGGGEPDSRLLTDAVQALASVWGAERVGVRLSLVDPKIERADAPRLHACIPRRLADEGVAYLHVVSSTMLASAGGHSTRELATLCRREFARMFLASGGYDMESAEEIVRAGLADAVALA